MNIIFSFEEVFKGEKRREKAKDFVIKQSEDTSIFKNRNIKI